MHAVTARPSSKYQVVIPKQIREILGLGPRDSVLFLVDGGTVILRPQRPTLPRPCVGCTRTSGRTLMRGWSRSVPHGRTRRSAPELGCRGPDRPGHDGLFLPSGQSSPLRIANHDDPGCRRIGAGDGTDHSDHAGRDPDSSIQGSHREALQDYEIYLTRFPNLEVVSLDTSLARETALVRAATGLRTPDAVQIAAACLAGADAIVTNEHRWAGRVTAPALLMLDDYLD